MFPEICNSGFFSFLFFFLFIFTLKAKLETKGEELYKKNLQASSDHCSALLQDIFSPLEDEVKQGIYSKPGGYCLFNGKIKELKKKYYEEPRKGVQVTKVMCVFSEAADLQTAELHPECLAEDHTVCIPRIRSTSYTRRLSYGMLSAYSSENIHSLNN